MSQQTGSSSATARELREAFDRSFAALESAEGADSLDVLAVRVAGVGYALRAGEVVGLFKDRPVTPLPSPAPELLGLTGLRGVVVPVYDLRLLLGHVPGERPSWLVLVRGPDALGLAFDGFEGQFRVPHEGGAQPGADAPQGSGPAIRAGGVLRRLVDVASLVERIRGGARSEGPAEER